MSSISKILESVSIRWDLPSYNEEKNEFKRYHLSSDDIDELKDQFRSSNMTELSDYVWSNLRNTDSWRTDTYKKAVEVAVRHRKDYKVLIKAMLDEKYIKSPIVLKHKGKYELVAGNTRLMLCRAFGIRPKVLMISLKSKANESLVLESFQPSWQKRYYEVPELSEYLGRRATIDDILYYWKEFGYKLIDTSKFHTKISLGQLDSIKEWDREVCPRNTEEENAELEASIKTHGYKLQNPMMVILDKYEKNPPKVGEGCHRIMILKRLGYSPETMIPVIFRFVDNTPEELPSRDEELEDESYMNEAFNKFNLNEKKSKTSKLLNKKTPTVAQLAKKYGVDKKEVFKHLKKGIKVEREHTKIKSIASEIARDHLGEDLFYYEKLKKIEERYGNLLENFIVPKKKAEEENLDEGFNYWYDADDDEEETVEEELIRELYENPKALLIRIDEKKKKKKKADRCVKIAKRKYHQWPSAYASGAVVKCRQGKIWKGVKESKDSIIFEIHEFSEDYIIELLEKKYKPVKDESLKKWFDRNNGKGWIDCKTGKPCGRKKAGRGTDRKYPACRPTKAHCNKVGTKRKKGPDRVSWKSKSETKESITEINWKGLATGAAIGLASLGAGKSHAAPEKKPAIIQTQKKDIHEAAIGFIEEYKQYIEEESSRDIDFELQKSLALAQAKFRGFDIDEKSALEHYERFLKKISDIKNRNPELYEAFLAIGKTTDIRIVKYKDGGYNAIVKSTRSL